MSRVLLLVMALVLVGCETTEETPQIIAPPFGNDPTDPVQLGEWWTNGNDLLRLEPDGGYAFYASNNPHYDPVSRGSWERETYAGLRLDPYELRRASERVEIIGDESAVILRLDDGRLLTPLDGPPRTIEDELRGTWSGGGLALTLEGGMRYAFDQGGGREHGRWHVDDDVLQLIPDATNRSPRSLRVRGDAGTHELAGAEGVLKRPG